MDEARGMWLTVAEARVMLGLPADGVLAQSRLSNGLVSSLKRRSKVAKRRAPLSTARRDKK